MPGYGTAFSRGLILGAGAALLYAAARESMAPPRPRAGEDERAPAERALANPNRLIDWDLATRVAVRTAGRTPSLHPGARAQIEADYAAMLREIEGPIAAYVGNDLSLANTVVEVLDRPGWIRANMLNFRYLLQPVEDFYAESLAESRLGPPLGFQSAARMMLSSQVGVLVGYLSRRVLGQYDVALLAEQPVTGGKLFFVEPNLRQVEHTLNVPPDELRRWIALHEATHAHEFELYPWVRPYLNASLRQYLKLLIEDMRGRDTGENTLLLLVNRFVANLRHGHNVLNALMSPQQRELMSRLQALMSLAEGYSNHVMNHVGKELLPNFDLIHQRVEHRQRDRSPVEQLFLKITGLSLKMEQYRQGERFVDFVVRERGIAFANRAWRSAQDLPTEAEIRDPERWIGRMEAA
ncbi:MAG: zinc-dependent metalloprotease [Chloroflexi bacterium]|nr:zinc-dependent metalloprotease [Chloroflexota bacterium]MBV9601194.1 zinc-dependent metalloprotease [Chloroflexota bacterium]